jgi:dephospho-CoA kinase
VYDAALLVETGSWRAMEALMVVSCAPAVQRARLLARNGGDSSDADARIAAQLPLAEKERVATWVLRNDGTVDALAGVVDAVVAELRARYGVAS